MHLQNGRVGYAVPSTNSLIFTLTFANLAIAIASAGCRKISRELRLRISQTLEGAPPSRRFSNQCLTGVALLGRAFAGFLRAGDAAFALAAFGLATVLGSAVGLRDAGAAARAGVACC